LATIVTRAGKGSPLTNAEVDANFVNLNNDKLEVATAASTYAPLTGTGASGTWNISITGNAATATNGVVTTGSYANPTWITSLAETKVLPSQTGNSGKFLTTNGSSTSWGTVDLTPYLTTATAAATYAPLGGAGTSGTWGISITGTAANVTGTVAIANGGTGATSAAAALTALGAYPASNPSGYTTNTGTVISVSGTGTASGLSLSGTVTTSGNITLSGTVNALAAGTYSISITGNAGNTSSVSNATAGTYTWTGGQNFISNNNTDFAGQASQFALYGGTVNAAVLSMHRPGAYGLNMGLDSDNVFRIGGWSASSNRLQMDMSGNLTMAGNVTANSDEKLKKNWRPVVEGFVSKLANIKSGIYDRVDQELTQAGVSAQSLQTLLPEVIGADNEGTLHVAYGNAALVAAVELAKTIEELRLEIAQIKQKVGV